MATQAQTIANQKNAAQSTGPISAEGKAVSSQNAMKFGFTSQQVVLAHEDPAQFEAMHASLTRQLRPGTDLECMLVDEMAAAQWRQRRIEVVQNAYVQKNLQKSPEEAADFLASFTLGGEMRKFQKYAASYRHIFRDCWRKLIDLQEKRRKEEHEALENGAGAAYVEQTRKNQLQIEANLKAGLPANGDPKDPSTHLPYPRLNYCLF